MPGVKGTPAEKPAEEKSVEKNLKEKPERDIYKLIPFDEKLKKLLVVECYPGSWQPTVRSGRGICPYAETFV
jgi:predicted component of viral defense system (DUF524 family)